MNKGGKSRELGFYVSFCFVVVYKLTVSVKMIIKICKYEVSFVVFFLIFDFLKFNLSENELFFE